MKKVTRREFARTAAIAPIGFAAASYLLGQVGAGPQNSATHPPPKKAPNPEDAANRIFSVSEAGPFDAPLQFVRNEMPQKLKPFSLGDVTLDSGPLQQARDWN